MLQAFLKQRVCSNQIAVITFFTLSDNFTIVITLYGQLKGEAGHAGEQPASNRVDGGDIGAAFILLCTGIIIAFMAQKNSLNHSKLISLSTQ
jgi:hypothetical protein